MKKALFAALALCSLVAMTTGCIGGKNGFSLTRKVYQWNQNAADERWVNEILFLGCCIFPVYGLSAFADAVLFNSIEWWSGDNPIASTTGVDAQGNMYALASNGDGTATLTYKGETYTLTRVGDQVVVAK